VAAGSQAFQIERHEDKVFIKPLKLGASTDLLIWTATRRFAYELEALGEVANMSFIIDSRLPPATPANPNSKQIEDVADMVLTRAWLGAERIDASRISDQEGAVNVRVEHVFHSSTTLYVHYSVRNLSREAYRITAPTVAESTAAQATVSLLSISHTQIDNHLQRKLGKLQVRRALACRSEVSQEVVQPGQQVQGVLAIRDPVASLAILQLTFGPSEPRSVRAVLVL
jgi:hypothetical protein